MGELRRRYAWKREVEGNTLVMALWCGSLKLREKRIALKEHLYRIQEQSGRISEFRGLGTNKRPVAMIDWRMRSYRNIQELYQEETRGMRLKSFAPGIMKKLKEGIIQAGAKS
jgi:hypothetical protein